ncbi:MAG: UDP-3-O-(3-hydroxymyristoyl)glucosamine N-acyltransferase [Deltaproteobacteria bacterium]|jgi:UDP-3-O-[3-hydroxymyristoyl] glucosamine N-acyltransferase|nr:UDP-3-O-(3-hydroxymyristoyl)glucosamine N-acyltransferase [Deltaproteobacteria bacterium]
MIGLKHPAPLSVLLGDAEALLATRLSRIGGESPLTPTERGEGDPLIRRLAACDETPEPGTLTFAVKKEFLLRALEKGFAAVLTLPELAGALPKPEEGPIDAVAPPVLALSPDPRLLFAGILELAENDLKPENPPGEPFFKDRASCDIDPSVTFGPFSYVGANVKIGKNAVVGLRATIEDEVTIGDDCFLHPGVILRWRVKLGKRVIVHAGAVLGEDGFGYTQVPGKDGRLFHYKNSHLGTVVIGDDVEIGALACVDRGLVGDTVVGPGSKLDNLTQIGHNCAIGTDCAMASQAGVAGHSVVGDRAFLLGQSGVSHGSIVGADAIITGQCGVTGTIPPGKRAWAGTPSVPLNEQLATLALARRYLPRLKDLFLALKKSEDFGDLKKNFD